MEFCYLILSMCTPPEFGTLILTKLRCQVGRKCGMFGAVDVDFITNTYMWLLANLQVVLALVVLLCCSHVSFYFCCHISPTHSSNLWCLCCDWWRFGILETVPFGQPNTSVDSSCLFKNRVGWEV